MTGQARDMMIDFIDADFAANASGTAASGPRPAAPRGISHAQRRCDLAPDKPSRFEYTSASVEAQRVARVA
ncbi:hypothetical protein AUC69_00655 [Methyloceanibacter superfactus]|uniref:Uncharacterized protein n=1 Tax=Methyloceanibacter superfactus TaxID=1774969 RepID=A0A1E3W3P2_9HYPH|nr:hypothetical protein AUC69_00655 [Methyloceanibacter superfactus]